MATALVYWPALRAFLETDDFSLLAFGRILRNPLALFLHEHFPLGPYYRPLTMTLWWLSARAFGDAIPPQYAINLVLHLGVCLALWRLLSAFARDARASWVVTVLFAVHPIAIGTSLWLSDRFDLLATLFSLLALRRACDLRKSFSASGMAATFLLVAAALLSKEIGIVVAAAVCLVWAWPRTAGARTGSWWRDPQHRGAIAMALIAVGWLAWRGSAARAAYSTFVNGQTPDVHMLSAGVLRWSEDSARYALAWNRMPVWAAASFCAAALVAATALLVGRAGIRTAALPNMKLALACTAIVICAVAVLEAPHAYMWSVTFPGISEPAPVATYSRLFYFPLCTVALSIVAMLECVTLRAANARSRGTACRLAALCALLLALPWAVVAHELANGYRRQTNIDRAPIAAAVAAVAGLTLPSEQCRIFLLNLDASQVGYMLKAMPDAVIKALAPDTARLEHCLVQTEQAAWENTLGGAPLTPKRALPLRPMFGTDAPTPWIEVGGLQVVYLNLMPDVQAAQLPDALFLEWRAGRFEDVTADVRTGARHVDFVCARSPAQCRY